MMLRQLRVHRRRASAVRFGSDSVSDSRSWSFRPPAPGVCMQPTFDETSRSLVIEDACPFQLDRPAPFASYSVLLPE
jgi:hypothetical protein